MNITITTKPAEQILPAIGDLWKYKDHDELYLRISNEQAIKYGFVPDYRSMYSFGLTGLCIYCTDTARKDYVIIARFEDKVELIVPERT